MPPAEQFEILVVGSGKGRAPARSGHGAIGTADSRRGAAVDRRCLSHGCVPAQLEQELGGQLIYRERQLTRLIDLGCPSHNVRIIAASQFNQHEGETLDVRVLFTPY